MNQAEPVVRDALDLSGWFTEVESEVYRSFVSSIRSGVVVEVGVWKGRPIASIVDICRANGNRLYAVDTWSPTLEDPGYRESASCDVGALFERNLVHLGHRTTVEIIREDSQAAAGGFPDHSIDLVFLDADHSYEAVAADIRAWMPKVTERGLLCGHDYTTRVGVRRAVDEVFGSCVALPGGSIWVIKKHSVQPQRG
jgi:hypothetical protein